MRAPPLLVVFALIPGLLGCGKPHSASSPSASTPATLAPPPLGANLRSIGQGEIELSVASGASQSIDPLALARLNGGQAPACAGFVFAFSWQMQQGQSVRFTRNIQGSVSDVTNGNGGQTSIGGCTLLQAVNDGSTAITGRLHYVIADAGP